MIGFIKRIANKYASLPRQVKASLWFLLCSFITRGIAFITTPIYSRIMTTEEYGDYNVYASWYAIAIVIVTFKLSDGVYTQGLVKFDKTREKYSSALQSLTLTLCCIWYVIYLCSYNFWNNLLKLSFLEISAMFLMMWIVTVFNFWASEQRVLLQYGKLVFFTLCVAFTTPIVTIILMRFSDHKVLIRIWVSVIVSILFYSWMFFAHIIRGKTFFSKEIWKYAIIFNLPLIPHYLSQTILNSSDRIMIERMVGKSEAGIYSLAYSISLIMLIFNTSLLNTINPWIYQKIKNKEIKDIAEIAHPTLICIAILNILLIAFAPEAVRIFAPTEYHDAIWVIPPITMSVFFQFMYSLFADFEFFYEKTKYITLATLTGAVANLGLNLYFISKFGYVAAGYTTLICYIIYAFMHYIFMRKICRDHLDNIKPYNIKLIVGVSAIFIFTGALYNIMYRYTLARLSFTCIILLILLFNRKRIYRYLNSVIKLKKK